MATHISHNIVHSARLFMKEAAWGCFVVVFDSSGEPAGHPDFSDSCAPGFSGTEFEVGRTSCEDGVGATVHAPMDYESSMYCSTCCFRGDLGQFHLCWFSGSIEVPTVEFGEGTSRQKLKRGDRGDHAVPESLVVWCLWRKVRQHQQTFRVGTTDEHCWSRLSTMVGIIQIEELHSGLPRRFLIFGVLF